MLKYSFIILFKLTADSANTDNTASTLEWCYVICFNGGLGEVALTFLVIQDLHVLKRYKAKQSKFLRRLFQIFT